MKRWLFYKQKSTVVYPGRVKRRGTDREWLSSKLAWCLSLEEGWWWWFFPGEPWFLYYLGTSVLSCTNELEAPFFSPLVFYISQWEALWKLLKMCEQSFAVRKYNPMTPKRGGKKRWIFVLFKSWKELLRGTFQGLCPADNHDSGMVSHFPNYMNNASPRRWAQVGNLQVKRALNSSVEMSFCAGFRDVTFIG